METWTNRYWSPWPPFRKVKSPKKNADQKITNEKNNTISRLAFWFCCVRMLCMSSNACELNTCVYKQQNQTLKGLTLCQTSFASKPKKKCKDKPQSKVFSAQGQSSQTNFAYFGVPNSRNSLWNSKCVMVKSRQKKMIGPNQPNEGNPYFRSIWVFPKMGQPQNGWFIMENPIKMDDLGVPLFLETPIWTPSIVGLMSLCPAIGKHIWS